MIRTTKTLHKLLINDEDARACKEIPDAACQEVPGNFFKMLSAQSFTQLGDAIITRPQHDNYRATGPIAP